VIPASPVWYIHGMKRYHFPPMLGPASAHPVGSFQHGLCLGNEFDYMTERATDTIESYVPILRKAVETKPWEVWPDPPCGDIDAYCFACSGFTYRQLFALVDAFVPKHGLPAPD